MIIVRKSKQGLCAAQNQQKLLPTKEKVLFGGNT